MKGFSSKKEDLDSGHEKCLGLNTPPANSSIPGIPAFWNQTDRGYPLDRCVHELFEEQVEKTPDAIAVVYQTGRLTYRQLNEQANQLARYLKAQGVEPDTLVGVYLDRCTEMAVAVMAVLKAGGAYVPLDPDDPEERLAAILELIDAQIVLANHECSTKLPSGYERIFDLDSEWAILETLPRTNPGNAAQPRNLAYIMFTSGSTGAPKGVMVEHVAIVNHLCWLRETFAFTRSDRLLQMTPFTFDVSVYELFLPLIAGSTLVFAKPRGHKDPIYLNDMLIRERITSVHFVPSMLEISIQHLHAAELVHLKRVLCSGEALPHNLREAFFEHLPHVELHNLYGPTEAAIHVSWWDCRNKMEKAIVPIGRPIANTHLHILDDNLKQVPVGVSGELHIGGIQLARGYLKRPDLTREAFIPDPCDPSGQARLYKTGDLCRFLPDGNIEFLGRMDHQIQLRGIRIEPGEIEATLGKHPAVKQAIVLAREDRPSDKRLIAYLVCSKETTLRTEDLHGHLKTTLPDYMVPSSFVFLDSMPLTPNGKIDRDALPAPKLHAEDSKDDYVPPDTSIQNVVAEVFAEVLDAERIGLHDNFFKLGGHSLMATKAAYRIHSRLNVDVSVLALFENPTVAELSGLIEKDLRNQDAQAHTETIPRITRPGPLCASYAQKRMWFLYRLEHESPLYNVPFMLRLKGPLQTEALEESLNDIIRRHDSLRTTFDMHDDEPVQVVRPHTYQHMPVETIAGLSDDEPEKLAEHPVIKKEARALFDLKAGPLIRFRIFRLSKDVHILLFTVHHIVFDGWSVNVLLDELAEAYTARVNGREPDLPAQQIQYADYADWQKQWLKGETRNRQLSYWLDKLKGPLPILELPLDYQRPAVMAYQGRRLSMTLTSELSGRLSRLSNREGKTLFMTLLAAFDILLHRYTGRQDIIVGSPIANRTRKEIESMIGLFVNTLALRADLSGNPTFRQLLEEIQQLCLDAYANQDMPFEQLVVHLKPERNVSRPVVFQVMFVLQNAHDRNIDLPGLEVACEEVSTDTSKLDLTLFMEQVGDWLVATAEYNTDLFRADTIQELLSYYRHLLERISSDPDKRLSELAALEAGKHDHTADGPVESVRDYPGNKCVGELFEEQAAKTPNAVAVIFEDQRLTYRQLSERANRLAHYLRKRNVRPDTLVGIYMDRCTDLIVAILAILKAGGAYVPLDPAYPKSRLRDMIETSDCRTILTHSRMISSLDTHDTQIICLDTDWDAISREPVDNLRSVTRPDHLAYVMFTSGSTGQPKAVGIPHRGIVRLLFGVDFVDLGGHQTFLQLAPVSFDASTFEIWGALLHGHCCVLFPDRIPDLHKLARILETHHVSCLWLTSSLFNFIIDEKPEALEGVSQLLTGGEALSVDHVRRALKLLPNTQLINGYGPTESTTFACCYRIPRGLDERLRSIPIGRAIGHTQVYILDERLSFVPIGTPGELYIGGDGLARGYLNSPELTAERFIASPFDPTGRARLYKTGDLCRYLADGNIEFLGRLDDQVKIRGFRIEPGEIESALERHPAVRQVAVVACQDRSGEKRLVAYIVSASPDVTRQEDLKRFLKDILPDHMIPSAFVHLNSMPLTPNGKVDRSALPAPEPGQASPEPGYTPPETPAQKALVAIFAEVLKVKEVGINDDFFKLGGSSLLAVKLLDRIQSQFNTSLPLSSLFQATTVRQLCELLATGRAETTHSSIVLIRLGGPAEPIFVLPGVGGHSMAFQMLARQLPSDRPVYGLELRGLDGETKPHDAIEDMASYFIELISSIQEQGPYYLAGYSLGGRIAFEMALQLAHRGRQVGMLALIGSTAPAHSRTSKYRLARYALRSTDFLALPFREKLNYLSFKFGTDLPRRIRRWRQERAIRSIETKTDRTLRTAIEKVEAAAYKAWYDYKPKALYSGNALLIRETNIDSPLYRGKIHTLAGWERYITGLIECHKIESGHINILDEPYVGRIAEKIKSYIARAEQAEPGPAATRSALDGQNQSGRRPTVSWPSPPDVLQIPKDQLHIYLTDLDALRSPTKYRSLLSSEELNRADGYVQDEDRDRFVVRRGILRELLGRYVNLYPADIKLDYSEHGKPLLCDAQNPSGLTFSLATCGGMALYAFACDHPVGIDLECILPEENLLEMARRQFSCREYEDLSNLPQTLQPQAFYTCWTCKEAYIKARGVIALKQFDIAFDPGETPQLTADRADPSQNKQWHFSPLDLGDHWSAVVAIGCKNAPLRCWKIEQL